MSPLDLNLEYPESDISETSLISPEYLLSGEIRDVALIKRKRTHIRDHLWSQKKWSPDEIKTHYVENLGMGGHRCNLCGKISRTFQHAAEHAFAKHLDEGRVFNCPACGWTSVNRSSLRCHTKQTHGLSLNMFTMEVSAKSYNT